MRELLKKGAIELSIHLSDQQVERFVKYANFLVEKNKVMNLTTITDDTDIVSLHFLDSLSLCGAADFSGKRIIDIGSGAGFPGMPLKIADSSIDLTLLDALKKRVDFLSQLCDETQTSGVTCLHARAEEAALKMGDSFDFALSRAVARLNMLCELCMPFVKPGGKFIAMKSTDSEEEINEAKTAIKTLGGIIEKIVDYKIPSTDVIHRAVVIEKAHITPNGYPRRFSKIQKSPL